jgi:transcriptional regulator with XRE-family HTH domain
MSVANKVKAVLNINGKKNRELAKYLGLASPQALTNKFNRGSFSAEDLIKVADFLDCELAFNLPNDQKIVFDISDIRATALVAYPEQVEEPADFMVAEESSVYRRGQ